MIRISPNMAAKLYEPLMEFSENPIEGVTLEESYQVFGNGTSPSSSKPTATKTPCTSSETESASSKA